MFSKEEYSNFVLYFLVFSLGCQTIILELTLPRLLAPVFGNTLYAWTASIGVALAAIALGYNYGGAKSTEENSEKLIWKFAFFSCCWISLVGLFGDIFVTLLSWCGIIYGPLVATFLMAAAPIFAGSAVLPIAIALKSSSNSAGQIAGRLYAL